MTKGLDKTCNNKNLAITSNYNNNSIKMRFFRLIVTNLSNNLKIMKTKTDL